MSNTDFFLLILGGEMKLDEAIKFMQQCKFVEEDGTVRQCESNEVPTNVEYMSVIFKKWLPTETPLYFFQIPLPHKYRINNDLLPKPKKWVPYDDNDLELILSKGNCVKLINFDVCRWITSLDCTHPMGNAYVAGSWHSFEEMLIHYVYPDNTPFGKEVTE